jgi:hypothetical protein
MVCQRSCSLGSDQAAAVRRSPLLFLPRQLPHWHWARDSKA